MEFKRNSPLAFAIAIITITILLILSTKAQVKQTFNAADSNSTLLTQKDILFQKAPELAGISGYINAPEGLQLSTLKGKVILLDFWTYTCINCIRTIPYLNAWYEKYQDDGLVIIGVETPEFEFEKDPENVLNAVEKYGIVYPIVQDNNYATWNAYANHYWPHKYLIDADGYIRYDHIGEGGYEETEYEIQKLLKERDEKLNTGAIIANNITAPQADFGKIGTPELYLGYQFARTPLGNPEGFSQGQIVDYTLPPSVSPNQVYLEGRWKNNPDNMELVSDTGKVMLKFQAKNVNIVAGAVNSKLEVMSDSSPPTNSLGFDLSLVNGSAITIVNDHRLYSLLNKVDYTPQTITINVDGAGFKIYTFTFG